MFSEQLTNGQREILLQRTLVSILCPILALLRHYQKGMIAAAQLGLEVTPYAMQLSGYSAMLLNVVNAILVQHLFQVTSEVRTLQ